MKLFIQKGADMPSSNAYYEKYIRGIIEDYQKTGKLTPSVRNTKLLREGIAAHLAEREGVPTGGDDIVGDMIPTKKPSADRKPNRDVQRAKVDLFFGKLESTGLGRYLQFSNVLDQADAIVKFAKIVGVPSNKIADIITNFRNIATKRNADAEVEAPPEEPVETTPEVPQEDPQQTTPGRRKIAQPAQPARQQQAPPEREQEPAPEEEEEEFTRK